ncbi:MAG: hypothetical protein ACJAT2_002115 [Bacteriovoracaceae bacterium]|jgi:hypothetical protein
MKNKKYILFAVLVLLSIGKLLQERQKTLAPKKETKVMVKEVKTEDIQEVQEDEEPDETENTATIKEPEVKQVAYSERPVQRVKFDPNHLAEEACPQLKPFEKEDIQEEEELATNIHFVKEGYVYRLRIFIEDSANGGYRKLTYYKEDQEGFPQQIQIPSEDSVNPSDEIIDRYMAGGKIVSESADRRIKLKDGRVMTYSEVDGRYIKLTSEQDKCNFEL